MGAHLIAGAKLDTLYGVDVSRIDPETSVALTKAILAREPINTGRRVIITWNAQGRPNWLAINDAETGELIPVCAMRVTGGSPTGWDPESPLMVELTELVTEDGKPFRDGGDAPALTDEYREHLANVAERRGPRRIADLTDEEARELDDFEASFTGAEDVTVTRRYEVAEMRIAGP